MSPRQCIRIRAMGVLSQKVRGSPTPFRGHPNSLCWQLACFPSPVSKPEQQMITTPPFSYMSSSTKLSTNGTPHKLDETQRQKKRPLLLRRPLETLSPRDFKWIKFPFGHRFRPLLGRCQQVAFGRQLSLSAGELGRRGRSNAAHSPHDGCGLRYREDEQRGSHHE